MMQVSQREKIAVIAAGVSVLIFALMQLVFFPMMEKRERLGKGVLSKEKQLVEMREMVQRYEQLDQKNDMLLSLLAKRTDGFSLFSFLESNAAESKVKDRIAYMKPSPLTDNESLRQSMVEMKLQGIGIQQLVSFLERTESPSHLVAVQRMVVQENKKEEGTLDVTLQITSVDEVLGETGEETGGNRGEEWSAVRERNS